MSRDLRARVGARSLVVRLPHRIVFGRRHRSQDARPMGESFLPVSGLETMSRRWFSVEDVELTSTLDGRVDAGGAALLVRAESAKGPIQIWDGGDPVRLTAPGRYLAQNPVIFVGDLFDGRIWGARIEVATSAPEVALPVPADGPGAVITRPPGGLHLSPFLTDVLLARYHRYYRHPPEFDPQPVGWAEVAVALGLIEPAGIADRTALRRALKDAQDAVSVVKQQIEERFPGWLPPSSQTQKTFHDHLRTVLEMQAFFDAAQLRGFDERHPRRP